MGSGFRIVFVGVQLVGLKVQSSTKASSYHPAQDPHHQFCVQHDVPKPCILRAC